MTDTEHPDRVKVYEAADGWRWNIRAAGNHEVIAASTEAYSDRRGAVTNLERVTGRKVDALAEIKKPRRRLADTVYRGGSGWPADVPHEES